MLKFLFEKHLTSNVILANFYLQAPGHHFIEDSLGEFSTNSSVVGSKVAVVSSPSKLVPV